MKISVVVPIYNVEKYIERCLDSILAQTYSDFELILVDDGSPDKSGDIAEEYAKKDTRVKALHKPNGGLSSARNYGIVRASGEYICFVDSDDWVEPTYLEELSGLLEKNEADIAICGFLKNSGEDIIETKVDENIVVQSGIDAIGNIYGSQYVKYVVAWNKMYRRILFDNVLYTEGIINEDEAICAQLYYQAKKVVCTDKVLYNYRVSNSDSIMSARYTLKRLDILKALEIRMDFYQEKKLSDYYEKDSFKYMYKILLNIIEIKKMDGRDNLVIKELKSKYWVKYKESVGFGWSWKRKAGMLFFGLFPKAYLLRYKAN